MTRYTWEGRAGTGHAVRGELDAPSKDAALAQLKASGVLVRSLEAAAGGAAQAPDAGGLSSDALAPLRGTRPGQSLRDKAFYLGVVALFTTLGLGTAYVAPVLRYDCARSEAGVVACDVERRVLGLVRLSTVRVDPLVSVRVETSTDQPRAGERRRPQTYSQLVLEGPGGVGWESVNSSWPMGTDNHELREGIEDVVAGRSGSYSAWQAEKLPLLVALTFQIPLALVLLALALRLTLGQAGMLAGAQALEQSVRRRKRAG